MSNFGENNAATDVGKVQKPRIEEEKKAWLGIYTTNNIAKSSFNSLIKFTSYSTVSLNYVDTIVLVR